VVKVEGDASEHYALVLRGELRLLARDGDARLRSGELIFVPGGAVGSVAADEGTVWLEIEAPTPSGETGGERSARAIHVDDNRFAGSGFAYQSLVDRNGGARALRMNLMQVQPGAGSPDFHIHAFAQIYAILSGEMTVDVGRRRYTAPANSIVFLPPGVVHRNYNASDTVERHISLLVPEPVKGEIFDYAVTIHEREAELLKELPQT
jgi:quercetin dioxygenase-like cupin family protein